MDEWLPLQMALALLRASLGFRRFICLVCDGCVLYRTLAHQLYNRGVCYVPELDSRLTMNLELDMCTSVGYSWAAKSLGPHRPCSSFVRPADV